MLSKLGLSRRGLVVLVAAVAVAFAVGDLVGGGIVDTGAGGTPGPRPTATRTPTATPSKPASPSPTSPAPTSAVPTPSPTPTVVPTNPAPSSPCNMFDPECSSGSGGASGTQGP
ncbi:hypothetical protein ABZ468_08235 [Streptomyces sp. NPDC005708]|uniref:hypothetical protein n=1 Tax=Streptomyces sp. NPDC005708 TaxID=3154564 RepID=UPI003409B6BE